MPKTIINSRLQSNKHKPEIKQELNTTKSSITQHIQSFKQKLLSGNGFIYIINELRSFSILRY